MRSCTKPLRVSFFTAICCPFLFFDARSFLDDYPWMVCGGLHLPHSCLAMPPYSV